MKNIFLSNSAIETENLARKFASKLKGNEVIAFYGDLGAGKTAFTRGVADFFGLKDEVSSPTFALVNEYSSEKAKIYHFDMYRINTLEDLESTGFFDYLGRGIILVEWSENIKEYLPEDLIEIKISKTGENSRGIEIIGGDFNENFSG